MAVTKKGKVTYSLYMSELTGKSKENKISAISIAVTAANVASYNGAADDAARLATPIGALGAAIEALTLGTMKAIEVADVYNQDAVPPDVDVFAFDFDKFLVQARDNVNGRAVKSSIPARDDADITIESDGVTLQLADGGDTAAFVTAFEAVALSVDSNPVTVRLMSISQ